MNRDLCMESFIGKFLMVTAIGDAVQPVDSGPTNLFIKLD